MPWLSARHGLDPPTRYGIRMPIAEGLVTVTLQSQMVGTCRLWLKAPRAGAMVCPWWWEVLLARPQREHKNLSLFLPR